MTPNHDPRAYLELLEKNHSKKILHRNLSCIALLTVVFFIIFFSLDSSNIFLTAVQSLIIAVFYRYANLVLFSLFDGESIRESERIEQLRIQISNKDINS
jgi:Ni,Fe-hydrogenase I cytochrome b subunit